MNKQLKMARLAVNTALFWFSLAAVTAWLLSTSFMIAWNASGDLDYSNWSREKWIFAAIAVMLTGVITAYQFTLYKSGKKGKALFIAMLAPVLFSAVTEIANYMQREGSTVNERSVNSSEYKETINSIGSAVSASVSSEVNPELLKWEAKKSAAVSELKACDRYNTESRKAKCRRFETKQYNIAAGQIKAIKDAQAQSVAQSQNVASAMVDKAKELAFNENYHFEIIKVVSSFLSISAILASFTFSLLVIGTFEFCFHQLGDHYEKTLAQYRKLLSEYERNTNTASDSLHQSVQPIQQPIQKPIQSAITATSPYSTANANKTNLGSITSTQAATIPQSVPPSAFNGIGFTATQNTPLSAPVQRNTDTESGSTEADTELYQRFITECKAGAFKGDKSDFTSIQTKDWIAQSTGLSKGKSQALAKEWLDKAGNAGEFKLNPHWTEGSRANKWSIK